MKFISLSLILLISGACSQHRTPEKSEDQDLLMQHDNQDVLSGVVYFSPDNGQNWVNASNGLPKSVTIGLGGTSATSDMLGLATKEFGVYLYDFKDSLWMKLPADPKMLKSNVGAMAFHKDGIFIGTQHGGVFFSDSQGQSWVERNVGLENLTIRRFAEINSRLYAGTNYGLYTYNDAKKIWELEYEQPALQVNGITASENIIYLATNQGAFKSDIKSNSWERMLDDRSLHNIGAVGKMIYAMTYNELFVSEDAGNTWTSMQKGLPKELYTFNVIGHSNLVFAGQWDGVYIKTSFENSWRISGNGLPIEFAATNLTVFRDLLVVTTSERGLRAGMTIEK